MKSLFIFFGFITDVNGYFFLFDNSIVIVFAAHLFVVERVRFTLIRTVVGSVVVYTSIS